MIGLNNLQCNGTEIMLSDCPSGVVTSCDHSEDAGIQCQLRTGKDNHKIAPTGKISFSS